ncbi:MAG: ATP-binding protein [Saprospiraceae bacterium]|nr:ATP-binding protein [Saprospiraceae bacterium]
MLIERQIKQTLLNFREWFPIVYLGGPRQSGKTTLLRNLLPELPYASLEDADTRRRAEEDPRRFLNGFPKGAILDEAQRTPHLFNYLQGLVDTDRSKRFVLSGSQNFLLMESITQSLAGRVGVLQLMPLAWPEINRSHPDTTLEQLAWKGGYPTLYSGSSIPPEVFFDSYIQTYLERDVRMLKNVGDISSFGKFMRLCAGRVGQPLNMTSLANDTGVATNTVKAWIAVLEASYLVFKLPPYFENFNKRIIKSPKLYFFDTGLLCNLLGITSSQQLENHYFFGNIIENALVVELFKKRLNVGKRPKFWFWQDQQGNEVDLIIEEEGTLSAIEFKSSQTYNTRLWDGLKRWNTLNKATTNRNYLVYAGNQEGEIETGMLLPWEKAMDVL